MSTQVLKIFFFADLPVLFCLFLLVTTLLNIILVLFKASWKLEEWWSSRRRRGFESRWAYGSFSLDIFWVLCSHDMWVLCSSLKWNSWLFSLKKMLGCVALGQKAYFVKNVSKRKTFKTVENSFCVFPIQTLPNSFYCFQQTRVFAKKCVFQTFII